MFSSHSCRWFKEISSRDSWASTQIDMKALFAQDIKRPDKKE